MAAPLFDSGGCCGAIGVSYLIGTGPPVPHVAEAVVAAAGAGVRSPGWAQRGGGADGVITEALLLDEQLVLSLGTRQLPPPLVGEALVRVAWAGVCGSDLHVLRTGEWVAYWPATLGHEVVGVVQECPGAEVAPGTVVVVDSRIPCRRCAGCQKAVSLCENISWLGEAMPGGFARHLVVPVTSLVRCPPQIEPAVAVLAEPLAVAMHAVSSLMRRPDDVLVLGYGPVGALVHLELARRWPGLAISVSEILGPRRQLAMALGARLAPLAPGDERASTARFSLVVDTAGYPQSLSDVCTLAGKRRYRARRRLILRPGYGGPGRAGRTKPHHLGVRRLRR